MKYTITINCDNAAFDPEPEIEVSRILKKLADDVVMHDFQTKIILRDINGNRVGESEATQ